MVPQTICHESVEAGISPRPWQPADLGGPLDDAHIALGAEAARTLKAAEPVVWIEASSEEDGRKDRRHRGGEVK